MNTPATNPTQSGWVTFGQFWATFARMPRCWMVLARNLVPVAGVYILGWPFDLGAFNIWFDGVVGITAMVAVTSILSVVCERRNHVGWLRAIWTSFLQGILVWVALLVPYAVAFRTGDPAFRFSDIATYIRQSPELWLVFITIALTHILQSAGGIRLGVVAATMADGSSRPAQAELVFAKGGAFLLNGFVLFARGFALCLFMHGMFGRAVIPLLALALTYLEVLSPVLKAMPAPAENR